MADLLDGLNAFLLAGAGDPWIYLAILAACVIDGLIPPVPSETVVIALAAWSAAHGEPMVAGLAAAAAIGAVVGDNLAYLVGRRLGHKRFAWMQRPRATAALAVAARELDRRGAVVILTARYVPIGRVAVNMTAGATGFDQPRFLRLSILGGLSWAAWSVGIGTLAGHWIQHNPLLGAAVAIVVAIVVGTIIDRFIRRTRAKPSDMPPRQRLPTDVTC